jgi:pectin methylesterase-like acyl-CoA thioesterase
MKSLALFALLFIGAAALNAKDLVVALDGSGDFKTVQAAIDAAPGNSNERTTILIRRGTYAEMPTVPVEKKNVTIRGEDRKATIIAATNNANVNPRRRELFSALAAGFVLENLTLHNTTPKGGSQAETIRVKADRVVLRRCDFKSFQDTLRLDGRVYVDDCYVEGDVDYVWGGGTVYFNHCTLHSLHDGYLVQSRNDADHYGYVFFECTLTGAPGIKRYALARIEPGRFPFSHVAFIDCKIGPFLSPQAWVLDQAPNATELAPTTHLRFWEFGNTDLKGKPLDVSQRLSPGRQLTLEEAAHMRDVVHVLGGTDGWTPAEGGVRARR